MLRQNGSWNREESLGELVVLEKLLEKLSLNRYRKKFGS